MSLRRAVRTAIGRWRSPAKPAGQPSPHKPRRVPLVDGIDSGAQRINTLTLRPLDMSDAPAIARMKPDIPGVLSFVERLSGIDFVDLAVMTQADFEVLAWAVDAHLKAFDAQLQEGLKAHGNP